MEGRIENNNWVDYLRPSHPFDSQHQHQNQQWICNENHKTYGYTRPVKRCRPPKLLNCSRALHSPFTLSEYSHSAVIFIGIWVGMRSELLDTHTTQHYKKGSESITLLFCCYCCVDEYNHNDDDGRSMTVHGNTLSSLNFSIFSLTFIIAWMIYENLYSWSDTFYLVFLFTYARMYRFEWEMVGPPLKQVQTKRK